MQNTSWRLSAHPQAQPPQGPVVVVVMDGVGEAPEDAGNAVALARTPTLARLRTQALFTTLRAHGKAVGMPSDEDMGNSEVGHNAMGAGRVFAQGARLVNEALEQGTLFTSETWYWLTEPCVREGRALHLLGLLSDGNVHSHIQHLFALLHEADRIGISRVFVHALLDGRDVPQTSAHLYLSQLEAELTRINAQPNRGYRIASGGGRMKVTMDRYNAEWHMVERGFRAHVYGIGRPFTSAMEALETFRAEQPGITDQNLLEFVIVEEGQPVGRIQDDDAVIMFNFRGDRAIEISQAFEQEHLTHFDRGTRPRVRYAGMMQYDGDLKLPSHFLVSPPAIDRTLGEYLARNGLPQCALAETQKFGHVTYFWNGNRSGMFDPSVEKYVELLSDTLPFEQRPWMKAAEVTDAALAELQTGHWRHLRINFANGDMVGHTGHLDATIQAVQAVDLCVARLWEAVKAAQGVLIVTADHGNADEMLMKGKNGKPLQDAQGQPLPKTSHTLNPVPFYLWDARPAPGYHLRELEKPGLSNLAATVLELLGYQAPPDYDPSLLSWERASAG